ncbi:MAG: hypothetical protein DMG61_13195 [Acidobacteria bacterium]|nr:MAG: hypothetical protein DMG61_13195 [Acidobacteriota bacterium]
MKFKLALFFAVVLFVPILGEMAHAQLDQTVKADVPFDFYAGKQKMPAGSYTLKFDVGSSNVEIFDADNHGMFLLRNEIQNVNASGASLLFDRLGDRYFLKTIETSDLDIGFPVNDAERRLALNTSPTPVVVAANTH